MEAFKTLGTKLPRPEAELVEAYCKRKGTSPSKLIRNVLLREINVAVPHNVAGNNVLNYNKEMDTFSWGIKLDNGQTLEVVANMSPQFLEDFLNVCTGAVDQRDTIINKKNRKSVAIPTQIVQNR